MKIEESFISLFLIKGRKAYKHHADFHRKMIQGIMEELNEQELEVLVKAIHHLDNWFREVQQK